MSLKMLNCLENVSLIAKDSHLWSPLVDILHTTYINPLSIICYMKEGNPLEGIAHLHLSVAFLCCT